MPIIKKGRGGQPWAEGFRDKGVPPPCGDGDEIPAISTLQMSWGSWRLVTLYCLCHASLFPWDLSSALSRVGYFFLLFWATFNICSIFYKCVCNADKTEPFHTSLSSLLQLSKAPNREQLSSTPGASSPVLHSAYSTVFQWKNTHTKPPISPTNFKTLVEVQW